MGPPGEPGGPGHPGPVVSISIITITIQQIVSNVSCKSAISNMIICGSCELIKQRKRKYIW